MGWNGKTIWGIEGKEYMEKYLTILIDALEKKDKLLDQIKEIVDRHEVLVNSESFDAEEYNMLMEKKGELIAKMDQLDDGFTSLYARISPELKTSPLDYTKQIKELQKWITAISDKIALLQAEEMRVQAAIERIAKSGQPKQTTVVNKSEAAMKYYRTMNRTNTAATPIFINRKK